MSERDFASGRRWPRIMASSMAWPGPSCWKFVIVWAALPVCDDQSVEGMSRRGEERVNGGKVEKGD